MALNNGFRADLEQQIATLKANRVYKSLDTSSLRRPRAYRWKGAAKY